MPPPPMSTVEANDGRGHAARVHPEEGADGEKDGGERHHVQDSLCKDRAENSGIGLILVLARHEVGAVRIAHAEPCDGIHKPAEKDDL